MFVQCSKWIHIQSADVTIVIPKLSRDFPCCEYKGNVLEAVEHGENLCVEGEGIRLFIYLGDTVGTFG